MSAKHTVNDCEPTTEWERDPNGPLIPVTIVPIIVCRICGRKL